MESVESLIQQLKSDLINDRMRAARALVKYGPDAEPAIPQLISTLTDPNGPVTDSVMWALGAIGESAIEPLADAARNGRSIHRQMACYALGRYAQFATARLAALRVILTDSDEEVRKAAATSLVALGQNIGRDHEYRESPLTNDELNAAKQLYRLLKTFVGNPEMDNAGFAKQALMWLKPLQ